MLLLSRSSLLWRIFPRIHAQCGWLTAATPVNFRTMATDTKSADTATGNSWKTSTNEKGEYVRKDSSFRYQVTADGSSGFPAEAGRYHLYVSLACPWAHRTLVVRKLKKLEDVISVTVVHHYLQPGGWRFSNPEEDPACEPDQYGFTHLRQVYMKADPEYSANITVPVLWDKVKQTIVNNESSEIIRMFNTEFNALITDPDARALHLRPAELESAIDAVNDWVYPGLNNGVYRCGFAKSQEAYTAAYHTLSEALEKAEAQLAKTRYLAGDRLTEADIRLFTTLVRFDAVYYVHFKCNYKLIKQLPNLHNYLLELYQLPGVAETVNMDHIKKHYFRSHVAINPTQIVPEGPGEDFTVAHDRTRFTRAAGSA